MESGCKTLQLAQQKKWVAKFVPNGHKLISVSDVRQEGAQCVLIPEREVGFLVGESPESHTQGN